jgi:hypothetical protein
MCIFIYLYVYISMLILIQHAYNMYEYNPITNEPSWPQIRMVRI